MVTILVKHGANVNGTDNKSGLTTPLHFAVRGGTEWTASIVEFLLQQGANVDNEDDDRLVALLYATQYQSKYTVDLMTILVKHGANVNGTDNRGRTLFDYVVINKTKWTASIVEFLLQQGAVKTK